MQVVKNGKRIQEKRVEKGYKVEIDVNDFLEAFRAGLSKKAVKLADTEEKKSAAEATITFKSKDIKKAIKVAFEVSKDGYRIDTVNDVVEKCHFAGNTLNDLRKDAKDAAKDYSKWIEENFKEEKKESTKSAKIRVAEARVRIAEAKLRALKESEFDPDYIDPDEYADEYESEEERNWRRAAADNQLELLAKRESKKAKKGLKEALVVGPTGSFKHSLKQGRQVFGRYSNRRSFKESATTGFVPVETFSEDEILTAILPTGSKYAGNNIVWNIIPDAAWVAADWAAEAVIVRNLDTSNLWSCNPFLNQKDLIAGNTEEGISFDCVTKLESARGYEGDPVVFKIAEGEYFVDYWNHDTDETTTGVYFGEDVNDFCNLMFGCSEDETYDEFLDLTVDSDDNQMIEFLLDRICYDAGCNDIRRNEDMLENVAYPLYQEWKDTLEDVTHVSSEFAEKSLTKFLEANPDRTSEVWDYVDDGEDY